MFRVADDGGLRSRQQVSTQTGNYADLVNRVPLLCGRDGFAGTFAIAVEAPGHIVKVRLFGIDCPESKQEGGPQATWFTRYAAMDRTVTVIQHDTDRYGRMVADVVLPDSRVLNKELEHSGNAWWYSQCDRDDAAGSGCQGAAQGPVGHVQSAETVGVAEASHAMSNPASRRFAPRSERRSDRTEKLIRKRSGRQP